MSNDATSVLLIEDNEGDVRLMREWLAESHDVSFDLKWANSVAKGLAILGDYMIDVILLDLSLPDSHGADTFATIRKEAPQIPIIVLSGQDDESLAVKTVQDGAQDYLVKRYLDSSHLLVRSIRYSIERMRMSIELGQRMRELREALRVARKSEWSEPLCKRCETIESDDQFWRGLQDYIEKHALAAISNGICPRCYEQVLKSKLEDFRFQRHQTIHREYTVH